MRVVICCPTYTRPRQATLDAIEAAIPAMDAASIDHNIVWELQNPYISGARAAMLHKALEAKADQVVFLDDDVSFDPADLVKLIETEGDVIAGLYRFKKPDAPEEYMGVLDTDGAGNVNVREDGCIKATRIPAGFMKITRAGVERFMKRHAHLCYGSPISPAVDLFHHGAFEGVWWGEDYAFSRNYIDAGGEIWVIPDLNLTHHGHEAGEVYPGNYHQFLLRQLGGSEHPDTIREAA